jgi:hypothetical protein
LAEMECREVKLDSQDHWPGRMGREVNCRTHTTAIGYAWQAAGKIESSTRIELRLLGQGWCNQARGK